MVLFMKEIQYWMTNDFIFSVSYFLAKVLEVMNILP